VDEWDLSTVVKDGADYPVVLGYQVDPQTETRSESLEIVDDGSQIHFRVPTGDDISLTPDKAQSIATDLQQMLAAVSTTIGDAPGDAPGGDVPASFDAELSTLDLPAELAWEVLMSCQGRRVLRFLAEAVTVGASGTAFFSCTVGEVAVGPGQAACGGSVVLAAGAAALAATLGAVDVFVCMPDPTPQHYYPLVACGAAGEPYQARRVHLQVAGPDSHGQYSILGSGSGDLAVGFRFGRGAWTSSGPGGKGNSMATTAFDGAGAVIDATGQSKSFAHLYINHTAAGAPYNPQSASVSAWDSNGKSVWSAEGCDVTQSLDQITAN
jgi:hypothetical protein